MSDAVRPSAHSDMIPEPLPRPRRLSLEAPWDWLAAGWRDLWATPAIGLTYGTAFAVGAALLITALWSIGKQALFPTLAGGFLLIGPLAAVGLYDVSRRLARGERPTLREAITAGFGARGQLAFFCAALLFAFMAWIQVAFLLFMLFMGDMGFPPADQFIQTLLFTSRGLSLLIIGSLIGGVIAATVFAVAVVSVPMLLVRQTDAVSAGRASLDSVLLNPKPMALWAALVVASVAVGFATLLIGFIIAFPLLGHATWHAYADTFGHKDR